VITRAEEKSGRPQYAYDLSTSITEKLESIAKKVYHADGIELTAGAKKKLAKLEAQGFSECPICMAKTQYSFSDDAKLLGAPSGFTVTIRDLKVSAGAGFIVAYTGNIMTMPGLPKVPAANNIDINEKGEITGLF
jgi:formate--tetrahydrofolate ligase